MHDTTVPPRSLDLEALDPSEIAPAQYYALCREADARGIPVSLDDPASPRCVEDLIAWVARDRDDHALVEALRDALAEVGITAPDWIEEVTGVGNGEPDWRGAHVALAMHVEDSGTAESGPSVTAYPTRWVNVIEDNFAGHTFVFCSTSEAHDDGDTPQHEVLVPSSDPAVVAATLVGILRATGYETSLS